MKSSHQTPHGYPIKKFKNSKPPDHSKNLKNPNNANLHIVSNNDQKFSSSANNYNRNESSLSEESIGKNKTLDPSKISPYQYMRTIRFRGVPVNESDSFKKKKEYPEAKKDLSQLIENLNNVHRKLKELIYCKKKDWSNHNTNSNSKENFNSRFSIKISWLKRWHKDIFYTKIKNNTKKYKLAELEQLHFDFRDRLDYRLKELINDLEEFSKHQRDSDFQNDQFRKSDISYTIRKLKIEHIYIKSFLQEVHTDNRAIEEDEVIKDLKPLIQKIDKELKEVEQFYLASEGREIARSSFNYYTVNKNEKYYSPKDDDRDRDREGKTLEEVLKEKKQKLEEVPSEEEQLIEIYSVISDDEWKIIEKNKKELSLFQFESNQEKEWVKKYCEKNLKNLLNDKNKILISLDNTYQMMKSFKAEQKSIFYNVCEYIVSGKQQYSVPNNENFLLKGYDLGKFDRTDPKSINETFSLFQFQDKEWKKQHKEKQQWCEEFIKFSKDILNINKQINEIKQNKKSCSVEEIKSRKKKRTKLKKNRGDFLFGKEVYFKEYANFCEQYKKIAHKRGKLKASIKGLEKEKLESRMIDYWSFIYVANDKKQLWLVPTEKKKNARKFIYNSHGRKNYENGDANCLYCFESLTMRAFHKLCDFEEGSFVKNMKKELEEKRKRYKEYSTKDDENKVDENKLKEKDDRKFEYLKAVLKSEYANENLKLDNFKKDKEKWNKIFSSTNLKEFEKNLEDACYYIKKITLSAPEEGKFLKDYHFTILDISSYDLEERNKNDHQSPPSKRKNHTDLWKKFWKQQEVGMAELRTENDDENLYGKIRLNPEVKIFYRKEDSNLKDYLRKKEIPFSQPHTKKPTHRRLNNQLTLAFTLSLNAGKKYDDLAFSKPEYIAEKIDQFNKKINEQKINTQLNFNTAWKYGIDHGSTKLETLCLVRSNKDHKNNNKDHKNNMEFAKFKTYTLKDYGYKLPVEDKNKSHSKKYRKAIENLSYFITDNDEENKEIFDIKKTSCLDLTTAKVIKGKIVTNGDVMTYLKLKKELAKRRLYNLYFKGNKISLKWKCNNTEDSDDELIFETVLKKDNRNDKKSKNQNKPDTIYYYLGKYKEISAKGNIKKSLEYYLNDLKKIDREQKENKDKKENKIENKIEKHTPSIRKINHLKSAITANMVGVINHLQKDFPGFILFEDLNTQDMKKEENNKENENKSSSESNKNTNIYIHDWILNDRANVRRLENALYSKFQSYGWIPPHNKNLIELRDQLRKQFVKNSNQNNSIRSSQIGVIVFVDEEDTSQMCPDCSKKVAHEKKTKRDLKYKQKRFYCEKCHFDTYLFKDENQWETDYKDKERNSNYKLRVNQQNKDKFDYLSDLDDPDKVAAFNIARKIENFEKICKWDEMLIKIKK